MSQDLHKMTAKPTCFRCGRSGHKPTQCKYKTFTCRKCQKVEHLASVCRSKQPADRRDKETTSGQRIGSVQETVDSNDDYSSDSSGYLIFYSWALEQTSSYSQWISTQYQLKWKLTQGQNALPCPCHSLNRGCQVCAS